MKRILIILFAILIPLSVFSQQEPPAPEPDTFFKDLIKTLSQDTTKQNNETAKPKEEQPLPAPDLPVPEPLTLPETSEQPSGPDPMPVSPAHVPPVSSPSIDDASSPAELGTPIPPPAPPTAKEAKPKKEPKPKKEREPRVREEREIVPYIEEADPKSRAQHNYIKKLEKSPKRSMRLITLDPADIIFGRKHRSVESALENPANLGVRSEYFSSISILPINTIMLNVNTSTRPFFLLEEYFSTGELLSDDAEDSLIALLGPNGLELPIDIALPTLISFKMSPFFGTLYANSGLYVHERSRIPGEFFNIIFKGATFDDPFQMNEELGVNLYAYLKNTVGYGTYIQLPSFLGEIRVGGAVNLYAGAFSGINITNLELVPTPEKTSLQGTMQVLTFADTLSLFGEDGFQFGLVDDYIGIPQFTLGYDAGFAWRFKLNRVLPFMPKIIKNYFDVQVGVRDLGASIAMNHAYLREISFEAEAGDILSLMNGGDEFSMDSIMVLEERLIYADSSVSRPLGARLDVRVNYQPVSQLLLKFAWGSYLTEGINATAGPHLHYGLELYPIKSLCLHGSVTQKGPTRYWETGIKLYSLRSEFGIKARVYDLDFSITEHLSGAGIMLNWATYF
jgi:hypothetical protein